MHTSELDKHCQVDSTSWHQDVQRMEDAHLQIVAE